MREKHSDASCTGPDFYFEKALQPPSFSSPFLSFSRTSNKNNYKFVLLPSIMRRHSDGGKYSTTARSTLTYLSSQQPVNKDLRYNPVHSPGSNSTSKTSICTDDDYEEEDDDLNSHCGSLTYSFESWTVGEQYPHDEIDEIDDGYNAEDEETSCATNDICRSTYNVDHTDIDSDCFGIDVCFQPLDWLNAWIKETFLTLGPIQEDQGGPQSRLRLYDTHRPA